MVVFGIDVVETDANGEEVRVEGSYCIFEGIVTSATTIGSVNKLFGSDQNYSAGATTRVYITISTQQTKKLIDGLMVEHNRNGTHKDVTTNTLVVTSGITLPAGDIGTADIADAAVTGAKVDFAATGAGGIRWEELGRTTLGTAGDTITVSGLSARKYLMILIKTNNTGGTIRNQLNFNNDSSTNYAYRASNNFGTTLDNPTQSAVALDSAATANPVEIVANLTNIATEEKLFHSVSVERSTAGSGNIPNTRELRGKWTNTADAISRVDITNNGTGDYAIGSEVVVLGHN